jgi:hypothetical protein
MERTIDLSVIGVVYASLLSWRRKQRESQARQRHLIVVVSAARKRLALSDRKLRRTEGSELFAKSRALQYSGSSVFTPRFVLGVPRGVEFGADSQSTHYSFKGRCGNRSVVRFGPQSTRNAPMVTLHNSRDNRE